MICTGRTSTADASDRSRSISVPATSRASPAQDFKDIFSWRNRNAKTTVNSMLSLSTGTTIDAGPSWSAL